MACTSGKRGQCPILEFWTRSMELRGNTTDAASPTILLLYMLCRRHFCLMYNYRVHNNRFWIFLIQMEYRLQSMYNHMVGQSASVVSPFYFILLDFGTSPLGEILYTPRKYLQKYVFSCAHDQLENTFLQQYIFQVWETSKPLELCRFI